MDFISKELNELERSGLYRRLRIISSSQDSTIQINRKAYLSFGSNNYLGLATHPAVKKASIHAIREFGCGAGSSRLISGTMELHDQLERRIALFEGQEAAILFPTGYTANVGAITALVGSEDAIFMDRLNHASIIDAAKLSRAKLLVYAHNDVSALRHLLEGAKNFRRKLIVTDTLFSMDGDIAPLKEIVDLAKEFDAMLMVDEAHATGVLGANGRGVTEYLRLEGRVPIKMGTLSKAVGSLGGFVVGSTDLIELLRNKARSFIYTTALPPAVCAASIEALDIIEDEPDVREEYLVRVDYLRESLKSMGFDTMQSTTQIIPVLIGEAKRAMEIAKFLYDKQILAPAIRFPSVPKNTSRIRLSVMATHSKGDLIKLLSAFEKVKRKFF